LEEFDPCTFVHRMAVDNYAIEVEDYASDHTIHLN
jgi:hypothetical protein